MPDRAINYEPSQLVRWLEKKGKESGAAEGIQKDWFCAAAIVVALERQTQALDKTNELLAKLLEK